MDGGTQLLLAVVVVVVVLIVSGTCRRGGRARGVPGRERLAPSPRWPLYLPACGGRWLPDRYSRCVGPTSGAMPVFEEEGGEPPARAPGAPCCPPGPSSGVPPPVSP